MLPTAKRRCLQPILSSSQPSATLPSFLVPAFSRPFHSSPQCRSKIGRAPLSIPPEVTFDVITPQASKATGRISQAQSMSTVQVKGPLGEMAMQIPAYISIDQGAAGGPVLAVQDAEDKKQREMWGTTRAYLQNHILGVSEGHSAILRLVGVGYRATIENTAVTKQPEYPGQQFVNLKVGYSHPIELGLPKGVKASAPQPTRILLEGVEKEVVMQFAAEIRAWRPPEPYKGKGIFVNGESIKLKNKRVK